FIARQVSLGSFIGGALGRDLRLGLLQVCRGRTLQLRLGTGVIGGIGFSLRGGTARIVAGCSARQAYLEPGGFRLRFRQVERRFRLVDFRLIFARIDLYQRVALLHFDVVVDHELHDVAGNLRSDGGDVGVYLGIIR